MGIYISKVLSKLFGKKSARIVTIGLDAAGKTTILHRLAYNEVTETCPTIGFSLQQVTLGKLQFDCYDIGGQSELRHLWQHYYRNCDGLIFVFDSADQEVDRKSEAKIALDGALSSNELLGVPVLILANKQDLQNAMNKEQVFEVLGLSQISDRQWYVQECSAITGKGLIDGLKWLSDAVETFWAQQKKDQKQ